MKNITHIQPALSSRPTLGNHFVHAGTLIVDGNFTLFVTSFQKELDQSHALKEAPYPTTPITKFVKGFRMGYSLFTRRY